MIILFFLLYLALGYRLVVKLFNDVPLRYQISLSMVLGLLFGIWLSWVVSLLWGSRFILWSLLLVNVVIYAVFPLPKRSKAPSFQFDWVWFVYTIFTAVIFYYLFKISMLPMGSEGLNSCGPSWGDIPMHTSLISYFAVQDKFNFDYPLLINTKLSYPFLIDFFSGILYKYGATIQGALIWPTYISLMAFCQLLYYLIVKIYNKSRVAIISIFIFFLNGSFLSTYYFVKDYWRSGEGFLTFIKSMNIDYTQISLKRLELMNLISSHILPQRGIVFALATMAVILILLQQLYSEKVQRSRLILLSVVIGLLPFFHVHTFLVAGYFTVCLALLLLYKKKVRFEAIILPIAILIALALPQLLWQLTSNQTDGFLQWRIGWLTNSHESLVWFWLKNLGLALLLLSLVLVKIKKELPSIFSYLFIPSLFLFLVINVLNFQPNNFDNYKLFIYGWLVFSILIGSLVSNLLSGRYYSKLLAICVIIGLISPGILSVSRLLNASYLLVNTEEVEFAKQVADVVPRDQVILTTSSHNNPISMFSGRRIVMGYPGWLSSYGKDINSLAWIGIDSINLLKADQFMRKNAIKYIAVHNLNEVNQLNSSNYKLLIRSSSWSLYQITF